jgi:protocatechuate 3,4-dioxygenase alpha subunit
MADETGGATPSQTVGPFFHYALPFEGGDALTNEATLGERIIIEGRVIDGEGQPVSDALIEIWQANSQGRYHHPEDTQERQLDPNFDGFGRASTDEKGRFRFQTIKPGSVPGPDDTVQAPHISVSVFGRGLLKRLATRIYFSDEPGNEADPILALVPLQRRATLIASREDDGPVYRFHIILQGDNETVFFDL